jgi:hypothetical protein
MINEFNKNLCFSDTEINFMMNCYAFNSVGYSSKYAKTDSYHKIERKNSGLKLWEEMSFEERKDEFIKRLVDDLNIVSKEIRAFNKLDYLLDRALDPLDPLSLFYKMTLVKMGASLTGEGDIRIPLEVKEKIERIDLSNQQILQMDPIKSLIQGNKLTQGLNRNFKYEF